MPKPRRSLPPRRSRSPRRLTLQAIDFLVYSRAAPGASEHDSALDEEHWSYMDGFADGMVARGPTLAADRETWTGSMHILELPSAETAREFVAFEPYNRAGLFEEHLVRRFENRLGRTMWDAPRGSDGDPLFLVIAEASEPVELGDLPAPERLVVHGSLLAVDDARPVGVVLALRAPTRDAVDAVLGDWGLDARFDVQVHDWEFGGRR